jgi:hypothetical protein
MDSQMPWLGRRFKPFGPGTGLAVPEAPPPDPSVRQKGR